MSLTTFALQDWHEKLDSLLVEQALSQLENDRILFFPHLRFALEKQEESLLSTQFSTAKSKNISYDPKSKLLRGIHCDEKTSEKMTAMLDRFYRSAHALVSQLFPSYVPHLQIARTSYRPIEVKGRIAKSYKKDDTRLHIDAFPSNPVQGRRLLRVFTNINPHNQPRVWNQGDSFSNVASHFFPRLKNQVIPGKMLQFFKLTKSVQTPYDFFMLQIHNKMKSDLHYQKNVPQEIISFPAGSTWIVQTDSVSHAALSGQFMLEQTFYLPVNAMQNESRSPLRILEALAQKPLL